MLMASQYGNKHGTLAIEPVSTRSTKNKNEMTCNISCNIMPVLLGKTFCLFNATKDLLQDKSYVAPGDNRGQVKFHS